ncbi:MAG: DegV family protein [Lachnospiraceae bacterium]|nr:DegV family protein [Lachnospiraceae bacterium]
MKVAVVTDANSSLTRKTAKECGVYFMDMPVIIDGENYIQDENLTSEMFYGALADNRDVTTSQPSPGNIMDLWDRIFADGNDQIVYIPMSSGLSEACNTARMLAADYEGKVEVVDNHRISGTQTQAAFDAMEMAKAGYDAAYIKRRLEEAAYDQSIYIAVDTLEYLKKGGRVTPAGAALGTALGIKPVLTIQGGKLDAFAKVRGIKKCESKIIAAMKNDIATRFKDYDKSELMLFAAGTLQSDEDCNRWRDDIRKEFPDFDVEYYPLSLSIGAHIGPGSIAIGIAVKVNK